MTVFSRGVWIKSFWLPKSPEVTGQDLYPAGKTVIPKMLPSTGAIRDGDESLILRDESPLSFLVKKSYGGSSGYHMHVYRIGMQLHRKADE